jgi:hypothetical protein
VRFVKSRFMASEISFGVGSSILAFVVIAYRLVCRRPMSAHPRVSPLTSVKLQEISGDTAKEHSIAKSNQKEVLSTEIQCTASCIGDKVLSVCSWKQYASMTSVPWR